VSALAKPLRALAAITRPSRPVPRGAGQRYPPFFRFFYPDRGDFLGFVSDFHFRAHSGFPLEHVATFRFVPGVAWSDHRPFWRNGYRALMVTDTPFTAIPIATAPRTRPTSSPTLSLPM